MRRDSCDPAVPLPAQPTTDTTAAPLRDPNSLTHPALFRPLPAAAALAWWLLPAKAALLSSAAPAAAWGLFLVGVALPRLPAKPLEVLCLAPFACAATLARCGAGQCWGCRPGGPPKVVRGMWTAWGNHVRQGQGLLSGAVTLARCSGGAVLGPWEWQGRERGARAG